MLVEPETKIMQTGFSGQTSLKSCQVMRALTSQTQGVEQPVIDGFDDLAKMSQPAAQRLGSVFTLAGLMRRADYLGLVFLLPTLTWSNSSKAFIGHIWVVSGWPTGCSAGIGSLAAKVA